MRMRVYMCSFCDRDHSVHSFFYDFAVGIAMFIHFFMVFFLCVCGLDHRSISSTLFLSNPRMVMVYSTYPFIRGQSIERERYPCSMNQ